MKKRIVAMFLAVCFVVTLLPTAAFAANDAAVSLTVKVNQGQTLEQAIEQLGNENLSSIETLDLDTADGAMLTIADINYIKQSFTGLQTLDLTDADFIDNQNWNHPWQNNTADIEHQFPDCAFNNNKQLTKVIFGSKIKSIGAFAFSGCTTLQDVQFVGSNLEVIDNDAFADTPITAINMPETVSYLGYGVFRHTNLIEVKIPSQVKEIKYDVFADCKQLTKVDLGSVEAIDGMEWPAAQNAVFLRCTSLKSIRLPETLQNLGGDYTHVFNGCDIVVDATANPNIKVGQYAFASGNAWADHVECKAFVYLQKETQNVTANGKIGVAITNGGTFGTDTEFEAGKLATPKKEGFKFNGWYETADFSGEPVETAVAGKTYYAKYTEKVKSSITVVGVVSEDEEVNGSLPDAYEEDTITLTNTFDGIPEGKFVSGWEVVEPQGLAIENNSFKMPAQRVKLRAILADEPPEEEPGQTVSGADGGAAAAVILGGAAIGAVTYAVGTQIWMETHLPDGVIPTSREQLALMLWNAAGRPQPAEAALYADISAEAADTQLAARWCVEQGLMKDYGESFKPGKYTFRWQVIKTWNQMQKMN